MSDREEGIVSERPWNESRNMEDAPVWFGADEASAWASGWNAAVEAAEAMVAVLTEERDKAIDQSRATRLSLEAKASALEAGLRDARAALHARNRSQTERLLAIAKALGGVPATKEERCPTCNGKSQQGRCPDRWHERCPTCGSAERDECLVIPAWRDVDEDGSAIQSDDDIECDDPWHFAAPRVGGSTRHERGAERERWH